MKRTRSEAHLHEQDHQLPGLQSSGKKGAMAPSFDNEGFGSSDGAPPDTTTVAVVGAGPSGLMLA